jgi:hypothetical protein
MTIAVRKGKKESWKVLRQHFIGVRYGEQKRVGSNSLNKFVKEARDILKLLSPDLEVHDLNINYLNLVIQLK